MEFLVDGKYRQRTEDGKHRQRIAAFAFGVVFLSVLLAIAIFIPHPATFQIFVFRIVLAMAAAGAAAMIPGFMNVSVAEWVRAGGAIAVFAFIYAVNPPGLVTEAETHGAETPVVMNADQGKSDVDESTPVTERDPGSDSGEPSAVAAERDQKPSRNAAAPAPSEVRADIEFPAQTREIPAAQDASGEQTLAAECTRSPSYDGLERLMRLGLAAQATVHLGPDDRSRSEALEQLSLAVRCLQEFKARGYESTDSERFLRDAESELTASR